MTSVVQYQAKLLTALESRNLDVFSQLLQDSQPDPSCLETACREPDCVEFVKLLLERGVDPNTVNPTLQLTPLHVAAELGYSQVLEALLSDSRTDVNSMNGLEQTSLHLVVINCKEDPERFRSCLTLLVAHHIEVNALDWLGNAALRYALENGDQETALLLLKSGAYLGTKNYKGELLISGLEPDTLETFLNSCIELLTDTTLSMKYKFLVPDNQLHSFLPKNRNVSEETAMKLSSPIPEMDPILAIAASPKLQHLILHPVLSSFTVIKWQRIHKLFFLSLIFHFFFIGILITLLVEQFLPQKDDSFCQGSVFRCFLKIGGHVLLGIYCICQVVKFVFLISMSPIKYVSDNSFDQFIMLISATIVLFTNVDRNLAAMIFLFAWIYLFSLAGQHYAIAVYFYLYEKIAYTFFKIFCWSCLLIFAFSFSFYALFQDTKTFISEKHGSFRLFWNPFSSVFTTVGMFVGGFETKFLDFESSAVINYVVFIFFCFYVLLVLTNMLTSIAVQHGATALEHSDCLRLIAMAKAVSNIERCLLGNPLYIHLRMKQWKLNNTKLVAWTVRSVSYLWTMCNWRRYLKGMEKMVVMHPLRSVVFALRKDSGTVYKYIVEEKILRNAMKLAKGEVIYKCQEERLSEIQSSLKSIQCTQQEIVKLLKVRDGTAL